MQEDYVFLDIETTGLDPDKDEIIEIGAVKIRQDQVIDTFQTLVRPMVSIPPRIVSLTGITDDTIKDAPIISEVINDVLNFIGDSPIFGHNISFDINFLEKKFGCQINNSQFDTINLAYFAFPTAPSFRLEVLKNIVGVSEACSHRALADAESARCVFVEGLKIFKQMEHQTLLQIHGLLADKDWFFAKHLLANLRRAMLTFPENKIGGSNSNQVIEPAEVNNLGIEADKEKKNRDIKNLLNFFEPDGALAVNNPGYRYRPSQVEMMETVLTGFANGNHMVIEGGTGTGKSLAYLVPAVIWALKEKVKVVLATHTINLQEQLWEKEIPLLWERTGIEYKSALVKGRSNYLCIHRWKAKLRSGSSMSLKETVFLLRITAWLAQTKSGDKSELNIHDWQAGFWNDISSDQELCLGQTCRWHSGQCFVTRARKTAETADILVVNHSLLLSDIKLKNKLLPSFDYLVIDEAHHLENSATQQLGWIIDINQLRSRLFSVSAGFGKSHSPGILARLRVRLSQLRTDSELRQKAAGDETMDHVQRIIEAADETEAFLDRWSKAGKGNSEDSSQISVRIKNSMRSEEFWPVISAVFSNLSFRIGSFIQYLNKLMADLESIRSQKEAETEHLIKELGFNIKYFEEIYENLNQLQKGDSNAVFWVQNFRNPAGIRINSAPVNVNSILREALFQSKKSILLTSATLSVEGSFEYFMDRIGLTDIHHYNVEKPIIEKVYPSPFDYTRQSLMCVIRELPDPTKVSEEEFAEGCAAAIAKLGRIFDGHTMVLFTSHKMLQMVYYRLKDDFETGGITLLGHGIDGGRSRLAEEFRNSERAVLFGASSFWEGVDIPGKALQCVVMVRLPFAPPNSPVVEARHEELTGRNLDAFYSYSVPEAVIKIKQGFGRLIRTEDDEGVAVILDRRIVDRRYGHRFLKSLPVSTHFKGDAATVFQKINDWIRGERAPSAASLNILQNIGDIEEYLMTRSEQ